MSAAPLNPTTPVPPKTGGVVVPHRARWDQRILAFLIYGVVRIVSATVRFSLDDRPQYFQGAPKEKFIFVLWHNRLSLSASLYRKFILRYAPDRRIAGLVSASRDGALLARIFELLRIEPVRGSSSRRGAQAIRELVTHAEAGFDLAITPDGPRGPCYQVQEGVISVGQLTGMPIIPVTFHLSWKIRLKSWDRFQIPLPFTRCHIIVGQPLRIPRELCDADREQFRLTLETELRAITGDESP